MIVWLKDELCLIKKSNKLYDNYWNENYIIFFWNEVNIILFQNRRKVPIYFTNVSHPMQKLFYCIIYTKNISVLNISSKSFHCVFLSLLSI